MFVRPFGCLSPCGSWTRFISIVFKVAIWTKFEGIGRHAIEGLSGIPCELRFEFRSLLSFRQSEMQIDLSFYSHRLSIIGLTQLQDTNSKSQATVEFHDTKRRRGDWMIRRFSSSSMGERSFAFGVPTKIRLPYAPSLEVPCTNHAAVLDEAIPRECTSQKWHEWLSPVPHIPLQSNPNPNSYLHLTCAPRARRWSTHPTWTSAFSIGPSVIF